jgi:hypothetical protein
MEQGDSETHLVEGGIVDEVTKLAKGEDGTF